MPSSKQNAVFVNTEQKAVLAALIGLACSQSDQESVKSLSKIVAAGVVKMARSIGNSPDSPGIIFYLLDEEDDVLSALLTRLPPEMSRRDIFLPKDLKLRYENEVEVPVEKVLETMQKEFGEDWVVTSGKFSGKAFSYKGEKGLERLVFSYAADCALETYFNEINPKDDIRVKAESRGDYLKVGDILHFIMCKTTDSFIDEEDGRRGYTFTWYDLTINIVDKVFKKTTGGRGRYYPSQERNHEYNRDDRDER